MKLSIVIRTLNEDKYLGELLSVIKAQKVDHEVEVVVIDSGSTDATLRLAKEANVRITHIKKDDFSFGRSLNDGCAYADGDILVFVSGHCVPKSNSWLATLVEPLLTGEAGYTYGRQLGRDTTKFSEHQVFGKYFPARQATENADYFCNNANAAMLRSVWQDYKFDENITGLEDMELAKRFVSNGGKVSYVPAAGVFHIHDESWSQVRWRYEREALALQNIVPELGLSAFEALRFFFASIFFDARAALSEGSFRRHLTSIISYRSAQYLGSYSGGKLGRAVTHEQKQRYFFPGR